MAVMIGEASRNAISPASSVRTSENGSAVTAVKTTTIGTVSAVTAQACQGSYRREPRPDAGVSTGAVVNPLGRAGGSAQAPPRQIGDRTPLGAAVRAMQAALLGAWGSR
jgi:hypothetical protein